MQPATLALFVVTAAVWLDGSAWWTKLTVSIALAICLAIDARRALRSRKAGK